jgi:ribosomal protein S18 acetylase RimI-like enzyme
MERDDVRFRPMRAEEFAPWREEHLRSYTESLARRLGQPAPDASRMAAREIDRALPDGLNTPGAQLVVIEDAGGQRPGTIWWGPHPRRRGAAYVYDIVVDQAQRGRGLGRAAMNHVADAARQAGFGAVGLTVTEGNAAAQHLYHALGYTAQSVEMLKPLA